MSKNRNPILLSYCPHGLNENVFKPLTEEELTEFKSNIFKNQEKDRDKLKDVKVKLTF
jgi:hypothetical protein